jgi:NarL family two-component system response regulator LiaR
MLRPYVRVIIVDEQDQVRNGLAVLLEAFEDLVLVGTAANGEEAIQLCDRIEPDVVLMDLFMAKSDGITITRTLRQRHPQIQVVALIGFSDEEMLKEVLKAGAAGYVSKNASIDRIAETIRASAARVSSPRPGTVSSDKSPAPPSDEASKDQGPQVQSGTK